MLFSHIATLFLSVVLIHSCANEKSEEERQREETEREVQRLKTAETEFVGYLSAPNDEGFIPVKMMARTLRNPIDGDNQPIIQTELTIGLFGGVTFRTTKTSFDFGSGQLIANFSESGGPEKQDERRIEWRATIQEGKFVEGQLISSIGTMDVVQDDRLAEIFAERMQKNYSFALVSTSEDRNYIGSISLENLEQDTAAPAGYSVPRIPVLRSAIRFEGTGLVPQNATNTIYDPLKGTLELFYPGNSRLIVNKIFLSTLGFNLRDDLKQRELEGLFFKGAEFQTEVAFISEESEKTQLHSESIRDLPPEKFAGKFRSRNGSGMNWDVSAKIEYVGDIGINNEFLTFRSFPQLKLTLYRCLSGRWWSRQFYNLRAIDFLNNKARFTLMGTGSSSEYDLVLVYENGWNKLKGFYMDGESAEQSLGSGASLNASDQWEFELRADPEQYSKICNL